jgi:hypothetical protein
VTKADGHHRVRPASAALGLRFCSSRWSCFPNLPGRPQTRKKPIERCLIRNDGLAGLVGQHDKLLLTVADLAQQFHGIEAFQCFDKLGTDHIGRAKLPFATTDNSIRFMSSRPKITVAFLT